MTWKSALFYLLSSALIWSALPSVACAEHEDKVFHGAATFAVITASYKLCRDHWDELSDEECLATAYGLGVIAAMTKECIIDSEPDNWDHVGNLAGIGLSIPFIIFAFD